jgi:acetyl esterase/lipase
MKVTGKRPAVCFLLGIAWLLSPSWPVPWSGWPVQAAEVYRVVRDVTYVERADAAQTADLYLPTGAGPFPGVLMVHGGAWMAGNKHHSAWHARQLARRGFAVMSINYRLAPRHPFPAQLEDCRAALHWMVRQAGHYPWDPARLAAYGYSAGGHLVCLLGMIESQRQAVGASRSPAGGAEEDAASSASLVRARDGADGPFPPVRLRAIVAGGAPCDFCDEPIDSRRLAFWLGGTRQERPQAYRDASPTQFVTAAAPPVFFFHGQRDRVVPLASPSRLFERLRQEGIETQLHVVTQAGHLAAYLDEQAFEAAMEFLDRELHAPDQE